MKKFFCSVAACFSFMTVVLTGCSQGRVVNNNSTETVLEQKAIERESFMTNKKILITYFSVSEHTKKLAETIHAYVGGDLVRIEPVVPYSTDYKELTDYAKKEHDESGRPAFKPLGVDPEDYDVIFVGYPVWWYTIPMIIHTFFDTYDLSGKIIVPFNTHEGSGDGGTYDTIKKREPEAMVLDGLPIRGDDTQFDQSEAVLNWLHRLDLIPAKE